MGRQIQLSMLPDDADALLTEIRKHAPVEVVVRDEDSADVATLASASDKSDSILVLWNKSLTPTLKRKWITARTPGYYSVDYFTLPVLEFSLSVLTEWQGNPALTQGRIYGIFDSKPVEFEKWYERIVRYIRKNWRKNPVSWVGGYVGPAASEWFDTGGLLLPTYIPPVTSDWLRILGKQHLTPTTKSSLVVTGERIKLDPHINQLVRFKLHELTEMKDGVIRAYDGRGYWIEGGSLAQYLRSTSPGTDAESEVQFIEFKRIHWMQKA